MNDINNDDCGGQTGDKSPCCSSRQTWRPVESPLRVSWDDHQIEGDEEMSRRHDTIQESEHPSEGFYEELFCTSQTSIPLVSALMTSLGQQSDVVKQGYLGKLERRHRRYFVLRTGSHTGPSRLEWYKTQEKFTAVEKLSGKAALFRPSKQGVIYLRCCIGVSRIGSSRKGHAVALYDKDQTMVLVMEDQQEQEEWYVSMRKLMEEERKDEEPGDGFDEEDDGYCTLPPAAFLKEVWPVSVKVKGLGRSKSLAGESRLCLTATSLILIRVGPGANLPSVTIPLLSVRRFGHLDGSFFLELGRSAPHGPGEIWLDARDQGNPTLAQHIHEVLRETVKSLRVLPDFSRSPTSNPHQLHTLLPSKRSRLKYRDKTHSVTPLASHFVAPTRSPAAHKDQTTPECVRSRLSPHSSDTYVEMKRDHQWTADRGGEDDMGGRESGDQEGLGYVMMSPQASHSSSVLPQDEYLTMASPREPVWAPDSTSLHTSLSRFSLHPTQQQLSQPQNDEWKEQALTQSQGPPAQTGPTSPGSAGGSGLVAPFVISRPGCPRPRPKPSWCSDVPPVPDQSAAGRYCLSACLPSCLQAEDR